MWSDWPAMGKHLPLSWTTYTARVPPAPQTSQSYSPKNLSQSLASIPSHSGVDLECGELKTYPIKSGV